MWIGVISDIFTFVPTFFALNCPIFMLSFTSPCVYGVLKIFFFALIDLEVVHRIPCVTDNPIHFIPT